MNGHDEGFRFSKIRHGKPYLAIVNLEAEQIQSSSEIIENYSGHGFTSQGFIESIPQNGYHQWKVAVRRGIEFCLKLSNQNWRVTLHSIEGRIATDTNPAIAGYTAILAFYNSVNQKIDTNLKEKLDHFVFQSWDNGNDLKIPDFETLAYD